MSLESQIALLESYVTTLKNVVEGDSSTTVTTPEANSIDSIRKVLAQQFALQSEETDSDGYENSQCVFVDEVGNVVCILEIDQALAVAALQTRYEKTSDDYGFPIVGGWGGWFLRDITRKLISLYQGESELAKILCLGDSWVKGGNRFVTYLTRQLTTKYGDGGIGIVSLGRDTSSTVLGEGSDWALTVTTYTGTQPVPDYDGGGINLTEWNPQVVGDKFSCQLAGGSTADSVELHYLEYTGGGEIRYRFNGGAWTTIDTDGAGGYTVAALAGVPGTADWLLEIELLSGTVYVYHADIQKDEGVRVHRAGHGGSRSDHYAGAASTWDDAFTELDPDLTIICLGTNDMKDGNLTPSQYYTNLTSIVTSMRSLKAGCDILILPPCENLSSKVYAATQFRDEARKVAFENNCAIVDGPLSFGDTDEYDENSPRELFNSGDPLHPTDEGSKLMVHQMLKVFDV